MTKQFRAFALVALVGVCVVQPATAQDKGEVTSDSPLCGSLLSARAFIGVLTNTLNFSPVDERTSEDLEITLALVEFVLCFNDPDDSELVAALLAAVDENLAELEGRPFFAQLPEAALRTFAFAGAMLDVIEDIFDRETKSDELPAAGFVKLGCDGTGLCLPRVTANGHLEVFAADDPHATRPFAPEGDFDGDGATNREEYESVMAARGSLEDYAKAATNPLVKGAELLPARCGSALGGAAGNSVGDGLMVMLAAALLALVRVKVLYSR